MVRKKHAAKKRTYKKRTYKRGTKRAFKRYYRKKAKTKTGKIWKYIKRVTKKEKGRLDALVTYNATYSQASARGYLAVDFDSNYPFRYLTAIEMFQNWQDVTANGIGFTRPYITYSSSNGNIVQSFSDGRLGYFIGLPLYVNPRQGTGVNQISGNEFFLDSLNFTIVLHRNSNSYQNKSRYETEGGSVSYYLIIHPCEQGQNSQIASTDLFATIFDNVHNLPKDASVRNDNFQSKRKVRDSYFFKKRNINLSPKVKIIRLCKVDYSNKNMAVTASVDGTTIIGTSGTSPAVDYWDISADYYKVKKVSVKIKRKLSVMQQVDDPSATTTQQYQQPNYGNQYCFYFMGLSSDMRFEPNTPLDSETISSTSDIICRMQCEAIFHDV